MQTSCLLEHISGYDRCPDLAGVSIEDITDGTGRPTRNKCTQNYGNQRWRQTRNEHDYLNISNGNNLKDFESGLSKSTRRLIRTKPLTMLYMLQIWAS